MLELCQARLQRLQANAPSIETAFNYNDAAVSHHNMLHYSVCTDQQHDSSMMCLSTQRCDMEAAGPVPGCTVWLTVSELILFVNLSCMQEQLRQSGANMSEDNIKMAIQALQSFVRGLGIQPGVDMRAGIRAGVLTTLRHMYCVMFVCCQLVKLVCLHVWWQCAYKGEYRVHCDDAVHA